MSFVETLRNARRGVTPTLHEFKVNYDGDSARVHVFVEGYEDMAFYRPPIQAAIGKDRRIFMYRCGTKKTVYDLHKAITDTERPTTNVLFFVDKDLSDILGETWPQDDRIFVTDTYSVENYLVSRAVVERVCYDMIRLSNVEFDFEPVFQHFEDQLESFHRQAMIVMAWVIAARSLNLRPNLNNINMDELFTISDECTVARSRNCAGYLAKSTGVLAPEDLWLRVLAARRRIDKLDPKTVIRGKFELWFLVAFARAIVNRLTSIATEVGGRVGLKVNINLHNVIETFAGTIQQPTTLQDFLNNHFPQQLEML